MSLNKKIPAIVRQNVWNIYIGAHIGKTKCLLCQQNDIEPFQFHCAHVIAQSKGGSDQVQNLRPICSLCNQSMSNHNLIDFAKKYYPNSPIHQTFKNYLPSIINEEDQLIPKKIYQCCDLCGKEFNTLNGYNYHVNKKVCERLMCRICGKFFSRKTTLQYHLSNKVCENIVKYTVTLKKDLTKGTPFKTPIKNQTCMRGFKGVSPFLYDENLRLKGQIEALERNAPQITNINKQINIAVPPAFYY
jgi:hypothetical protein